MDFIKIDVEGAEAAALKGMRSTLNQFQPSLLIELHGIAEGREEYGRRLYPLTIGFRDLTVPENSTAPRN